MQKTLVRKSSLKNKYKNLINLINNFEKDFKLLTKSELRSKNNNLKKKYKETNNLNVLLAESFALTREASSRTLGLRHFDVQLLGGIVLNDQKIAEMKTGEGKTLVATLPACLNAITDKSVHIVTVNEYLANRDQVAMGQVYRFLGLSTGLIQQNMSINDRKQNYFADILYVTNSEISFDFLRDNTASNSKKMVLKPFNYCIIDEVDSILIDEAQTPLILSNKIETNLNVEKYIVAAEISNYLYSNKHYNVDEKNKNIILTEQGSKKIEKILSIQDLYDIQDPWIPYIINAIKAKTLFFNNVQYIIKNNKILIVDEFTGRIMPDRRWNEGLHQAIEAKEKLPIRKKSQTIASITYQNFFLLYPKLSGMTGTGKTSEVEFQKIYNLSVEQIPTARPSKREDLTDLVYKDQFSKWDAIAKSCNKISSNNQPILIGTTTIQKSEMLAQLLNEYKLNYQILNAKPENIRRESEIVAQAGQKKIITIATNMAGRGTDIILGGNIDFKTQKKLYNILTFLKKLVSSQKLNLSRFIAKNCLNHSSYRFVSVLFSLLKNKHFLNLSSVEILKILKENDLISNSDLFYQYSVQFLINELTLYYKKNQKQENKIVKNLGGLYIIGTERNDSRRIDNQLRGRCGRQGDPGKSRFFLSLDDTLLRLFGGPKIQQMMQNKFVDNSPLESKILTQSLNLAQQRIEERSYQQRKNLFDYDDILNKQRNIVYKERNHILKKISIEKTIFTYIEQILIEMSMEFQKTQKSNLELTLLFELFENLFGGNLIIKYYQNSGISFDELKLYLFTELWLTYQSKIVESKIYGNRIHQNVEKAIILKIIDNTWRQHLEKMTILREAVGWRGYGQRKPLDEYKKEAFSKFENGQKVLRYQIGYNLLHHYTL